MERSREQYPRQRTPKKNSYKAPRPAHSRRTHPLKTEAVNTPGEISNTPELQAIRQEILKTSLSIDAVTEWVIKKVMPIYGPYLEARKHPETGKIGETRNALLQEFPPAPAEINSIANLSPQAKTAIDNFCERFGIQIELEALAADINKFISTKGVADIGAYRIYDDLNRAHATLQKFQKEQSQPFKHRKKGL